MTSFQPDCLLWRTISRSWTWPAPCVSNLYGRKQLKTVAAGTVRESEDGHAKRQTLGRNLGGCSGAGRRRRRLQQPDDPPEPHRFSIGGERLRVPIRDLGLCGQTTTDLEIRVYSAPAQYPES
jgi:hypothetical protein